MEKKWSRESLKNLRSAIWLIGLGVLFLFNLFWPGILILIGLSIIIEAVLPPAEDDNLAVSSPVEAPVETPESQEIMPEDGLSDPVPPPLDEVLHLAADRLPKECPACGGPVRENASVVKTAGMGQVVCPFCGRKIPTA